MRIALLSDIHGNLEALEAVLHGVCGVGVDMTVCLGDVVGYGPDPVACMELVAAHADLCILGNHDEALINPNTAWDFNARALASLAVTRRLVPQSALTLLTSYRRWSSIEDLVTFTHGAFGPSPYSYLRSPSGAVESFEHLPTAIGVVGHTHLPSVFMCDDARIGVRPDASEIRAGVISDESRRRLPEGGRLILNPGSVGQPRDGNPHASWGVLDLGRRTFGVQREAYDVKATEFKMHNLGLPSEHSARLKIGA